MDKIKIVGGNRLQGSVILSGSKNAALPILVSSLLTAEECTYERVPNLQDIEFILRVLGELGAEIDGELDDGTVKVKCEEIDQVEAPYDLVRKMRASVLVLGPLLARFGEAKVSLPGGCAIGARPINFHLEGLKALGAQIELQEGYVIAKCKRLKGNRVTFPFPSVGATEHLMMAASLAQGETVLENCAREPEIVNLGETLNKMGVKLEGAGEETIRIQGRDSLNGGRFRIMADRIEAGTYLTAGFITQGKVKVEGLEPIHLEAVLKVFEKAGARISRGKESIELEAQGLARGTPITTEPFPGFPTDMQAQFMALMCVAQGESEITETIFENRFMHVSELTRLGADVSTKGNVAVVRGVHTLNGAPLMATDLRASASLIVAGLVAKGETVVSRVYHLDRGYERLEEKLSALGANIERLKETT